MTLFLESVACIKQDDVTGKDDIYIQINGATIAIVGEIASGEEKHFNNQILLANGARWLELWEKDTITPNDKIGSIDLLQYNTDVKQEVMIENESASYKLGFTLIPTI